MVSEAMAHFSRLDILVNNAGSSRHVPPNQLDDLDEQLFELTVGLKIQAPIYLARACREQLAASGNGQIINITSVAGIAARGSSIVYAAANAALSSLTQSLARALAPGIRLRRFREERNPRIVKFSLNCPSFRDRRVIEASMTTASSTFS